MLVGVAMTKTRGKTAKTPKTPPLAEIVTRSHRLEAVRTKIRVTAMVTRINRRREGTTIRPVQAVTTLKTPRQEVTVARNRRREAAAVAAERLERVLMTAGTILEKEDESNQQQNRQRCPQRSRPLNPLKRHASNQLQNQHARLHHRLSLRLLLVLKKRQALQLLPLLCAVMESGTRVKSVMLRLRQLGAPLIITVT
jgi:hypothetical protein